MLMNAEMTRTRISCVGHVDATITTTNTIMEHHPYHQGNKNVRLKQNMSRLHVNMTLTPDTVVEYVACRSLHRLQFAVKLALQVCS